MKALTLPIKVFTILTGILVLTHSFSASAQNSATDCNLFHPLTTATHSNLTVTSSTLLGSPEFSNPGNVIDADTSNVASWNPLLGGSAWIEVEDGDATGGEVYAAGTYVGFVIENNGVLELLGDVTVTTYLGATEQESISGGSLLSVGLITGKAQVGFHTTLDFDRARITVGTLGLSSFDVYHVEIQRYCAGPDLSCNENTHIVTDNYSAYVNPENTGFSGVSVGSMSNIHDAIDDDTATYASVSLNVGIAATASFSIKDALKDYGAGTLVGFDIDNPALLGVDLLGNMEIVTYLDGAVQETITSVNLLSVPSSLLAGTGRQKIAFISGGTFDEVQLNVSQTLSLDLGTTRIYGLELKEFCDNPITACNELTYGDNPTYPTYVNGANTGFDIGVCVGCEINNSENVIDADVDNYASIVMAATVSQTVGFSVANAIAEYDSNTFVGFEIGVDPLLSASVAGSSTINLYNDGSLVQSSSGNLLLVGAETSILDEGKVRVPVGIISDQVFDEVQIEISQLISVSLGDVRIYHAIFTNTCDPTLTCDEANLLTLNDFPAYINNARTGTTGLVGALGGVLDPWNVVNDNPNDFAIFATDGQVAGANALSIVEARTEYPAGAIAGFTIATQFGFPLDLTLFEAITLETYLDGSLQESASGVDLINLNALGLITIGSGDEYNIAMTTTLPFNEVRIVMSSLVGVDLLAETHVYGAFVDTRQVASGPFACPQYQLQQDSYFGFVDTTITGNVASNDEFSSLDSYDTPIADAGNPAGATITMIVDGTFDFQTSTPGTYNYDVPVCITGITDCKLVPLTIQVNDPMASNNPPFAGSDFALGLMNQDIILNTLDNDYGADGLDIDSSSVNIVTAPQYGTASVDPVTGDITYTPNTGLIGMDTLYYDVCDVNGICQTTYQRVAVVALKLLNSVLPVDDRVYITDNYSQGQMNLLDNDVDLEGDNLSTTAVTETIPGTGTIDIASNGEMTFTPELGFHNTYQHPYEVCDDNPDQACRETSLLIVADPNYSDLAITGFSYPETSIAVGEQVLMNITIDNIGPNALQVNEAMVEISLGSQIIYLESVGINDPSGTWTVTDYDTTGNTLTLMNTDAALLSTHDIDVPIEGVEEGITADTSEATSLLSANDYDETNQSGTASIEISGVLPVNLLSFKLKAEGCTVRASWETASETENDRFELQRSSNGIKFYTVASVKGKGQASDIQKYLSSDIPGSSGKYIYRLLQFDVDGDHEVLMSRDITVDCEDGVFLVFPNPVQDQLRVEASSLGTEFEGETSMVLYSFQGKVLKTVDLYESGSRSNVWEIDFSEFEEGAYFYQILNAGEVLSGGKVLKISNRGQ